MPTPLTFCRRRGCHARVRGGGYCSACRPEVRQGEARDSRAYDRRRGTAHARGYASAAWRRARATQLQRHPLCADPYGRHPGLKVRASHVDHKKAKLAGGADAPANYQSLCASCHSYKTVKVDGGFGRRRAA